MAKCNCRFVLDTQSGLDVSQPVSERGWESILLAAGNASRKSGRGISIDLKCDDGEVPLLMCTGSEEGCTPLLWGRSDTPIAGLAKKPKRKRTKPPTPKQLAAQKRFSQAAAECKGSGEYRSCMSTKLAGMKKR